MAKDDANDLSGLGGRPSRSAQAARDAMQREIQALSPKERIALALAIGRRDAALREYFRGKTTRRP